MADYVAVTGSPTGRLPPEGALKLPMLWRQREFATDVSNCAGVVSLASAAGFAVVQHGFSNDTFEIFLFNANASQSLFEIDSAFNLIVSCP